MRGEVLSDRKGDALAAAHKILSRGHLRVVQVGKARTVGIDDGKYLLEVAQVGFDSFEGREQLREQ